MGGQWGPWEGMALWNENSGDSLGIRRRRIHPDRWEGDSRLGGEEGGVILIFSLNGGVMFWRRRTLWAWSSLFLHLHAFTIPSVSPPPEQSLISVAVGWRDLFVWVRWTYMIL